MSKQNVEDFQMITSASEAQARNYLARYNQDLERAIQGWFEAGEEPAEDNAPQQRQPDPVRIQPVPQPVPQPAQRPPQLTFKDRKRRIVPLPQEDVVGVVPGIYSKKDNVLVPLKALFVKAKVVNFIADVEIAQRFVNEQTYPIEAVFRFENHNAEMTNFEVTVDGKVHRGVCKDKQEAKDDYSDAIASGHGAYLVEKDKTEGAFKVSIGNLPPKKECILKIRYVNELQAEEDYLRLSLPVTRAVLDRSTDGISGLGVALDLKMPSKIEEIFSVSHDVEQKLDENNGMVKMLDQKSTGGREFELFIKLQNPHVPVSYIEVYNPKIKSKGLYQGGEQKQNSTSMDVEQQKVEEIKVEEEVPFVLGPQPGGGFNTEFDFGPQPGTDPFLMDFGPQPGSGNSFLDAFGPQPGSYFSIDGFPQPGGGSFAFVGFDEPKPQPVSQDPQVMDVVQPVQNSNSNSSASQHQFVQPVESKMRSSGLPHAVMLTLSPRIETDDDTLCEVIFLVDRSGSMAGSFINQAKNALQLFLRSLPFGTLFNIVGFGTTMVKLFPESVALNEETLKAATEHVDRMTANLIGTKILPPLQDILSQEVRKNFPRQLFCLTDGEVDNTKEVLDYVKKMTTSETRIFTFGIGADASKSLVNGMAQYGRGRAEFVVSGERMEVKVMSQLKSALQPILKDITVDWNDLNVSNEFRDLKNYYPPVFNGDRLIAYTFVRGDELFGKRTAIIKANTGEQQFRWEVEVDMQQHALEGSLVHRLAAANFARALEKENAKANRNTIVELGTKWGLVTKYTSYVAVEERDGEATAEGMQLVDVNERLLDNMASRGIVAHSVSSLSRRNRDVSSVDDLDEMLAPIESHASPMPRAAGRAGPPKASKQGARKASNKKEKKKAVAMPDSVKRKSESKPAEGGGVFRSIYSADEQLAQCMEVLEEQNHAAVADDGEGASFGTGSAGDSSDEEEASAEVMIVEAEKRQRNTELSSLRAVREAEAMEKYAQEEAESSKQSQLMAERIQVRKRELAEKKAEEEASEMARYESEDRKERRSSSKDKGSKPSSSSSSLTGLLFGKAVPTTGSSRSSKAAVEPRSTSSEKLSALSSPPVSYPAPNPGYPASSPLYQSQGQANYNLLSPQPSSGSANPFDSLGGGGGYGGYASVTAPESPRPQLQQAVQNWASQSPSMPSKQAEQPVRKPAPVTPVTVQKHSMMRGHDAFIILQSADGSFALSSQFIAETGLSKDRITAALPQYIKDLANFGEDEKLLFWTTAIAIAFLDSRFPDSKIEWELIAEKSVKFINKKLRASNVHETIRADATTFLG